MSIKLPRAAAAAVLFILFIEGGSWLSLKMFSGLSGNFDLVRMDSDFFNRNLRKYDTDPPRKKISPKNSWKQCWADGPYDAIAVGDSTGATGWVEMLRSDYGIKTLNLTMVIDEGFVASASGLIGNYKSSNGNGKTVLLAVGLIGRAGYYMYNGSGLIRESKKDYFFKKRTWHSVRLYQYINAKMKYRDGSRVEVADINGRAELFYADDIKGLTDDVNFSVDEYSRLCGQLKRMKMIAAEKGCVYAIVAFPTKAQQYEWLLVKSGRLNTVSKRTSLNILKEACEVSDVPFLDIGERLDPIARQVFEDTGRLLWYKCDTHMNELGAFHSAMLVNEFLSEIRKDQTGDADVLGVYSLN